MENQGGVATAEMAEPDTMDFEVKDVTWGQTLEAEDIQRSAPAGAVARALASTMSLPGEAWALRNDATAEYLDDETPIGEQLQPGAEVTLTPKAHLGGCTRG